MAHDEWSPEIPVAEDSIVRTRVKHLNNLGANRAQVTHLSMHKSEGQSLVSLGKRLTRAGWLCWVRVTDDRLRDGLIKRVGAGIPAPQ